MQGKKFKGREEKITNKRLVQNLWPKRKHVSFFIHEHESLLPVKNVYNKRNDHLQEVFALTL